MTEEQKNVLIEEILDEQYDNINTDPTNTSCMFGWNKGLKRATIIVKAFLERTTDGEWIDEGVMADGHPQHAFRCSTCGNHIVRVPGETPAFCEHCGSKNE